VKRSYKHLISLAALLVCEVNAQPPLPRMPRNEIRLAPRPRPQVLAAPPTVATNIVVDTTLSPQGAASGAITGITDPSNPGIGAVLFPITPSHGVLSTNGQNEFFSFQAFNVGYGDITAGVPDIAQFGAPNGVQNIVARVTGNVPTTIGGTVATVVGNGNTNMSTASTAGFWFVNPAGIVVTNGARFNVSGALSLGTADYVSFANGDRWYVIDSNGTAANPSSLSTASPASFGFLTTSPATGSLSVSAPNLGAPGSPVQLVAGGPIEIEGTSITTSTATDGPNHDSGAVTINSVSTVDISNATLDASSTHAGTQGGVITIQGEGVRLVDSAVNVGYNNGGLATASLSGPGTIYIAATGAAGTAAPTVDPGVPQSGVVYVGDSTLTQITQNGLNGGITAGTINLQGDDVVLASGTTLTSTAESEAFDRNIVLTGTRGVWLDNATLSEQVLFEGIYGNADTGVIHINAGDLGISINSSTIENINKSLNGPVQGSLSAPPPVTISFASANGPIQIQNSLVSAGNGPAPAQEGGQTFSSPAGAISISGAIVAVTGSTIETSTTNAANAGAVSISASGSSNSPVLQIEGASLVQSDATNGTLGYANTTPPTLLLVPNAGSITLTAPNGAIDVGAGSVLRTSAGATAGQAGTISLQAEGITLTGAQLLTTVATTLTTGSLLGSQAPPPLVPASISLTSTGDISLSQSLLDARTTGAVAAGSITLTGGNISISGGAQPDPLVAHPGKEFPLPQNTATFSGTAASGVAGSVAIAGSGQVSIAGATVSAQSELGGNAGNVSISGDQGLSINASSTISTQADETYGFGDHSQAGAILLASNGLIDVDHSQVSSQATLTLQHFGGSISIVGEGVRIGNQSQVTTRFDNGGEESGGSGTILVRATGTAAPSDPLQADLSKPTAGVVRIVDSGIFANNNGGASNPTGRGRIVIGTADASDPLTGVGSIGPDMTAGKTDDVLIAGAVISTDVTGGGRGAGIDISALKNVWIGTSTTVNGGYADRGSCAIGGICPPYQFPDLRSAQTQTLISTKTNNSDAGGDSLSITAGEGLTIDGGVVDARNLISIPNQFVSEPSTSVTIGNNASAAVQLTNAIVSSVTNGTAAAGPISIKGDTVALTGTSISTSTTGAGSAGVVGITATGTGAGSPALKMIGGSIASTAGGTAGANAGNITLRADNSTVQIGKTGDSAPTTTLSTSAEAQAGTAGSVAISGADITLANAQLLTTVATSNTLSNPQLGAVTLQSPGAISLTNSVIDARTTGAVRGGDVTVDGSFVSIRGGTLSASTQGSSGAGDISLTAGSAAGPNNGAALQISGTTVSSTASGTSSLVAGNAGTIRINAPAGAIALGDASNGATATQFLTSADASAGAAGSINVSSASDLSVANVAMNTSVATTQSATGLALGKIILSAPNGTVSLSGSSLEATTSGAVPAGDVSIMGASLAMTGGTLTAASSGSASAGDVSLTALQGGLSVTGGATLSSDASAAHGAAANAGSVKLAATNGAVQLGQSTDSSPTVLSTSAGAQAGAPGAISVTGQTIALGSANIQTLAAGSGTGLGSIQLVAGGGSGALAVANSTLDATTSGAQRAGEIDLFGAPISIDNSSIASRTLGTGAAGDICVVTGAGSCTNASGATARGRAIGAASPANTANITVDNSTLSTDAVGATGLAAGAGKIELATGGSVSLTNSALLSATGIYGSAGSVSVQGSGITVSGAKAVPVGPGGASQVTSISTATAGTGNAGPITVDAGSAPLVLSGATIQSLSSSSAADAGAVGAIYLSGGSVSITHNSLVSATSQGGTSGLGAPASAAITINSTNGTRPLRISDSTITTTAQAADGSNIVINAGGSPVTLVRSDILASAVGGNGGNITINDAGATTLASSGILAQAGPGNGGAINISLIPGAPYIADSRSLVSATAKSGNNGTVTISSPQTDLNSALRAPDVTIATAPVLASNVCRPDAAHSTFVREGRGGVREVPDDYQVGPAAVTSDTAQDTAAPSRPDALVATAKRIAQAPLAARCH
jgi:filamentous hemagglutinin family protein